MISIYKVSPHLKLSIEHPSGRGAVGHGFDSCRGLSLFGHDEHYAIVSSGISSNYCRSVLNKELKKYQRCYTFLPFLVA